MRPSFVLLLTASTYVFSCAKVLGVVGGTWPYIAPGMTLSVNTFVATSVTIMNPPPTLVLTISSAITNSVSEYWLITGSRVLLEGHWNDMSSVGHNRLHQEDQGPLRPWCVRSLPWCSNPKYGAAVSTVQSLMGREQRPQIWHRAYRPV